MKRHDPKDQSFSAPTCTNERFRVRAWPVSELFTWAYDLRIDQYLALEASLPEWARTEPYDFEAVAGAPVSVAQCKMMVQAMLADRFKLKTHSKKVKNSPGYELRVASRGHKLKQVSPADTGCGVHISNRGQERPCDRYQMPFAPKRAMSMKELAAVLSIYKSNPVRDLTGLGGEYKINLSFDSRSDSPDYLPLETALESQLGLVLRQANGDTDILLVDGIARPSAN